MAKRRGRDRDAIVGRLRAADPFELIRWLARSQPDPRKALAELVQNSIDANARNIQITRGRDRGVTCLHILDDGEGVIPELDPREALTYIATHIGHSRKRNLTPEQRRELMLQGKYGIGLLGFWAIGQMLEVRSKMRDQPAWLLRMYEDSPKYEVERFRSRLALGEHYTEVMVRGLHRPAFLSLTARRMTEYLAAELRGQLLLRNIRILVRDRIARGRAPKVLEVRPVRFAGERLAVPEEVEVPGYPPLRVELYLLGGRGDGGRVAVSCNGTVVYEDVVQFDLADFRRRPWTDDRLSGLLEFPALEVAPGSRRGVLPDSAAVAFASVLAKIEPWILGQLEAAEQRAAAAVEAEVVRQLEKAFRDVPRLAPEYDFFGVRARQTKPFAGGQGAELGSGTSGAGDDIPGGTPLPEPIVTEEADREPPELLRSGPLAILRIVPEKTRVERLGRRRLRAEAWDAVGLRIRREVNVRWECPSSLGRVEPAEGTVTIFEAGPDLGRSAIHAFARENGRSAEAEASVEVVDALEEGASSRAGIPEPVFLDESAANWRSRMRDGHWEVNCGHQDFKMASETARRKVRYLAALLGKEVVLHSFPAPQLDTLLERLVGLLALTERRLDRA